MLALASKKKADMEREEMEYMLEAAKKGSIGIDEKRRLERRIQELEDYLEEERATSETHLHKMTVCQRQVTEAPAP